MILVIQLFLRRRNGCVIHLPPAGDNRYSVGEILDLGRAYLTGISLRQPIFKPVWIHEKINWES